MSVHDLTQRRTAPAASEEAQAARETQMRHRANLLAGDLSRRARAGLATPADLQLLAALDRWSAGDVV